MLGIEVLARLCLPTMLALGLSLSIETVRWDQPRSTMIVIWVLWAAWLALVWSIHRRGGGELASRLATVDLVVRSIVCLALWVVGFGSAFADDGPIAGRFIGTKILLFALIMTCGIAIRFLLRPFSAAFATLVQLGSSPEREAAMSTALRRAQPLVVVIWASLLASVVVAVTQTVPWSS
jgi:hypothetical protein